MSRRKPGPNQAEGFSKVGGHIMIGRSVIAAKHASSD
jgi:hypothetical protein